MDRHRCIPLADRAAWTRALGGLRHAFAHTWESCQAMALSTGYPTFLYCYEDEGGRVVCPLSERTHTGFVDIVTPYGFSGFTGEGTVPRFVADWREFVGARGYVCGYIGLNPLLERPELVDAGALHRSNSVYVLDLRLPAEELYARLDTNRQRQLRAWPGIREGLVHDRPRLAAFFLEHYEGFLERVQASRIYRFSRETLAALAALPNVLLVGAGTADTLEAVTLVGHTEHVADYLFNVAVPEGRRHTVPLLWYAVETLRAAGVPALNLGGGIRPGDSVAQFKQRFGGLELPLGALKQVYRPDIYEALCREAGVDPALTAGYFPAYRRP